jgi:hypothetical protein
LYLLDRLGHRLHLPKRIRHFFCKKFDRWIEGDLDDWGEEPE